MEASKILVAMENSIAYIQIKGKGSFQNAQPVKTFYKEMLRKNITRFVVDLEECSHMDSTFLGTIVGLAMQLKEKVGKLQIINAGAHNTDVMKDLGLHRVSTIEIGPPSIEPARVKELQTQPSDQKSIAEHMLEAHETLMQIDPANMAKFKDVIAYLKEDLRQSAELPPL
jgi:anti-anti-sigma factor